MNTVISYQDVSTAGITEYILIVIHIHQYHKQCLKYIIDITSLNIEYWRQAGSASLETILMFGSRGGIHHR